jgi:hypothetical protein
VIIQIGFALLHTGEERSDGKTTISEHHYALFGEPLSYFGQYQPAEYVRILCQRTRF